MTQQHSIAISILIGMALIAGAIFFSGNNPLVASTTPVAKSPGGTVAAVSVEPTRDSNRRVFGDPEAPITIVEFSDVECPFCARLHPTLEQVVLQSDGQVQWEYRHLPLPMHRNAELGAVAIECVAKLTDNETSWKYLDTLLVEQRGHGEAFYIAEATTLGISEADFTSCLTDESIAALIAEDVRVAQSLGGRGTPFSVIKFADGSLRPVSGALPFEQWQALLQ